MQINQAEVWPFSFNRVCASVCESAYLADHKLSRDVGQVCINHEAISQYSRITFICPFKFNLLEYHWIIILPQQNM